MSKLLKAEDLAEMLGVTIRTINRRRAAGTLGIPEFNISATGGSQPRFRREDIRGYLKKRKTQ